MGSVHLVGECANGMAWEQGLQEVWWGSPKREEAIAMPSLLPKFTPTPWAQAEVPTEKCGV